MGQGAQCSAVFGRNLSTKELPKLLITNNCIIIRVKCFQLPRFEDCFLRRPFSYSGKSTGDGINGGFVLHCYSVSILKLKQLNPFGPLLMSSFLCDLVNNVLCILVLFIHLFLLFQICINAVDILFLLFFDSVCRLNAHICTFTRHFTGYTFATSR